MRLLIVEDNPLVAKNLATMIHYYWTSMDIDVAPTLQIAREKILQSHYQYWLIDHQLPDGTGIELLSECSIPKIIVGMSGDKIDPDTQARYTAFFQKPFNILQLVPYFPSREK